MLHVLQIGCEEGEIKKAIRLGKQAESGKPSPLLVEFCDDMLKPDNGTYIQIKSCKWDI